jgi:hypothetical protein
VLPAFEPCRLLHHFRFVIDDRAAEYGILKIEYVDEA